MGVSAFLPPRLHRLDPYSRTLLNSATLYLVWSLEPEPPNRCMRNPHTTPKRKRKLAVRKCQTPLSSNPCRASCQKNCTEEKLHRRPISRLRIPMSFSKPSRRLRFATPDPQTRKVPRPNLGQQLQPRRRTLLPLIVRWSMDTGGLPLTVNLMFFMCTFMDMSTPQPAKSSPGPSLLPKGFRYPMFLVSGLSTHTFNEFWNKSLKYLVCGLCGC